MCAPSQLNHTVIFILTELAHSYVCSRIYLHDPPGQDDDSMPQPEISALALRREQRLAEEKPVVNPWACLIMLVITVALMGVTAEFVRFSVSHSLVASPPTSDFNFISPRSSSTA